MLDASLETLVARLTEARGDLDAARTAFHAGTGPFEPADDCHEERIQAFFDWYLCVWARTDLPDDEVGRACRGAQRGLFRAVEIDEERARLLDLIGGMRVRVPRVGVARRLRVDDRFDGRITVFEGALRLMPGVVFHPAAAHAPMDEVLAEVHRRELAPTVVLDGLLRMRMRLDRFTSIRARHVYRFEALADHEILSAAWARQPTPKPS